MFLALDLGNSSAKAGLFPQDASRDAAPISTFAIRTVTPQRLRGALAKQGVAPEAVTAAGLCSVVPNRTQAALDAVEAVCGVTPTVVRTTDPLPVRMAYATPTTLGTDRLAAAVAAHALYGRTADARPRAVVAIDAGTAVTLEVVDACGAYRGGAILPGLRLQRSALARGTAQLPDVPPVVPASAIGTSTTTALQVGIVLGLLGALEGLVARVTRELASDEAEAGGGNEAPPFVVATGGSAPLLTRHLARVDILAPHLVLQGVRLLTDPTCS